MVVEMKTPMTPNDMMVKKLWKNFFFLTWNLPQTKKKQNLHSISSMIVHNLINTT